MYCRTVNFRGGVEEEDERKNHVMLQIWQVERPRLVRGGTVGLPADHFSLSNCDYAVIILRKGPKQWPRKYR